MTRAVDVSICIVNYNAGKYIAPCLESVFSQTKSVVYETIVVDNLSTDGSLREVRQRFPSVRIIENHENSGFARASNQAAREAVGEYLLFLNPDTELRNDAIGLTLRSLRVKTRKDSAICNIVNPDGTVGISRKGELFFTLRAQAFLHFRLNRLFPDSQLYRRAQLRDTDYSEGRDLAFVAGCFLMTRRDFFVEIGMFDERFFLYAEDDDLCLRLRSAGGRIFYFSEGLVVHWEKKSSLPDSLLPHFYLLESRHNLYVKHFGRFTALVHRMIILLSALIRSGIALYLNRRTAEAEWQRRRACFTCKWAIGLSRKPLQ